MADRRKVILVGGMPFNVPDELKEKFDIVKHYEQGGKIGGTMPNADYIFVISNWASHSIVQNVKNRTGLPVVWLKKGWSQMKAELERRSILTPETESVTPPVVQGIPAAEPPESEQEPAPTTGLSEDELWRLYGQKMIGVLRTCMKVGAKNRTSDVLDLASVELGPPPEDLVLLVPRLAMAGVVREDGEKLILMSAPGHEYDLGEDLSKVDNRHLSVERRIESIRGLPRGPYPSMLALSKEMSKYKELVNSDGIPLSRQSYNKVIQRAIESGFIERVKDGLFVNQKALVKLTFIGTPTVPSSPDPVPPVEQAEPSALPEPKRNVLSREEAEAKWPEIVERLEAVRFDVSEILVGAVPIWNPEEMILRVTLARQFVRWQLDFLKNPKVKRVIDGVVLDLLGTGSLIEFELHPDASGFTIQDGEYEAVIGSVKTNGYLITFRFSLLDPRYAGFGTEKTLNVAKDTDELCRIVEACGVKLDTFIKSINYATDVVKNRKSFTDPRKLFQGKRIVIRLTRTKDGNVFNLDFKKR